ncbi:hypothetical protein GCM10007977_034270 [Dactylosporangium sucinum]|uniref:Uncharacterized protein n=1 Tax=Dactylosporangium sucinum TaxID=1424081 RepID=A0A917TNB7_9ACTN|nr:hypothetical protein GCM10007977_034270 [Dactylosporangium sucinum]
MSKTRRPATRTTAGSSSATIVTPTVSAAPRPSSEKSTARAYARGGHGSPPAGRVSGTDLAAIDQDEPWQAGPAGLRLLPGLGQEG